METSANRYRLYNTFWLRYVFCINNAADRDTSMPYEAFRSRLSHELHSPDSAGTVAARFSQPIFVEFLCDKSRIFPKESCAYDKVTNHGRRGFVSGVDRRRHRGCTKAGTRHQSPPPPQPRCGAG